MGIAISPEHRELAETVRSLLKRHNARAANRSLLEAPDEALPAFWPELAELGVLGLHLPTECGGGGYGLAEWVVVAEALGNGLAPGPMVPTAAAGAVIAAEGGSELRTEVLPGLADGTTVAAVGFGGALRLARDGAGGGVLDGESGVVLGGGLATVFLLDVGEDMVVVRADAPGVRVVVPANLDPSRRSARVVLAGVGVTAAEVLSGARPFAEAVVRTLVAAEAAGGASACVEMASAYAQVREQFGRPVATFQAVKHHLANMAVAAELATAAAWDAAHAATGPRDEFGLAAAAAAAVAVRAFNDNADLNIQVHGGIGYTWEHDAHLFQRRAVTLRAIFPSTDAAAQVCRAGAAGVRRTARVELPPEVEAERPSVRAFAAEVAALPPEERRERLVDSGYAQPHWPRPWGLDASPGLQLLIEEEFRAAGVVRPELMITGWVILTLIQHGSAEQVARWVRPALAGTEVWCQLFSEPSAGSDAAAVRTRAERVDGGWVVNGQKVWTSDAREARYGLATVRTDPSAAKHAGITMLVIDMHHPGVEVRPLRDISGEHRFNEVFFTDVFVPDADRVGEPGRGWTVARATLGNERVSLGGLAAGNVLAAILGLFQRSGRRLPGAELRVGEHAAEELALNALKLRHVIRAVQGGGPGPEGNITKLVAAEHGQRAAALIADLLGPDVAFVDGPGGTAALSVLGSRALTIAGGTSEISRNQIAERILGLPRDPLIR